MNKKSSNKLALRKVGGRVVQADTDEKFVSTVKTLRQKHCIYYTDTLIPFDDKLDISKHSCYYEKYDKTFKSTNMHLGQRKLLLSEIQLLTEYYRTYSEDPILVYIGSATGSHLLILNKLFPKVKFILYDGARFDSRLKLFPAIFEIHEGPSGFVTPQTCIDLKPRLEGKPVIFVSDIRLDDADPDHFEKNVIHDMELQKKCVQILNPLMSLLKFRLPYNQKAGYKMEYLKGVIYYGIWAPPLSGETRLLVRQEDNYKTIKYDFDKYESRLFFHNRYVRPYCFNTKFNKYINSKDNEYCPCYDCIAELNIFDDYAKLKGIPLDDMMKNYRKVINYYKTSIRFDKQKGFIHKKHLIDLSPVIKAKCKS